MQLGNFCVSLAVKDIAASKTFYAKLGFAPVGGGEAQGWLILKNGDCIVGVFQGMFEKNTLTSIPPGTPRERRWTTSPMSGTSRRRSRRTAFSS